MNMERAAIFDRARWDVGIGGMEMGTRTFVRFALAFVALSGLCRAEEDKFDYAPKMKLLDQALAAKAPDGVKAQGTFFPTHEERGYEGLRFDVEPADAAKGSRWLAYDTGQKKIVALIEDLNAVCGQETKAGVPGQRVACTVGDILGTGPASGEGAYPGGHVIRGGKDIGAVEPTWSVAAFDTSWSGPLWMGDAEKDKSCRVALARSPDGKKFRLYGVLSEKIAYLGGSCYLCPNCQT